MSARLIYWKLELKRAIRRLPHMFLGAAVLICLMGTAAFLAGKLLYGEAVAGRIQVGVVMPENDRLSAQAVRMISSLESVKSLCDFSYLDEETCREKQETGELDAVLKVPEDFVKDILNGTNTPVTVILTENGGLENRIFKELADAGMTILGASQAGIYAGDELLSDYGKLENIPQAEEDLNKIYLSISLPRMDYFKKQPVQASGDVSVSCFYGISAFVLLLFFSVIPVSGFLEPAPRSFHLALRRLKIGKGTVTGARIVSLAVLLLAVGLPAGMGACVLGDIALDKMFLPAGFTLALICLGTASFSTFLFQAAGGKLGGVLLLFFGVAGIHFLSGGFLPLVFLPDSFRSIAPFLPSGVLMEGLKMLVTESWSIAVFGKLAALAVAGFLGCMAVEAVRK